eukprot:TRINITY_DN3122_c0_g3_i1.p1 TRINITY_DN3122_c0_g3~~TRINITY_DN3122_c0_g3_i1.p1  ORF type:complete len:140 (+),score=51.70 TRINITY_DN3122_c0_g3_i1:200-619(+)
MLEEVKIAFANAKKAQEELKVALRELERQENERNRKTEDLKKRSEEGSVVSRNKAKNELAQHLGEDPLPLRRAKITTEAAAKKADRTAKEAAAKVEEAEQFLNEVRQKPGSAKGALWWIDRELHEAKAFLPQSKGGFRK